MNGAGAGILTEGVTKATKSGLLLLQRLFHGCFGPFGLSGRWAIGRRGFCGCLAGWQVQRKNSQKANSGKAAKDDGSDCFHSAVEPRC